MTTKLSKMHSAQLVTGLLYPLDFTFNHITERPVNAN